jgi:hypothetical protein
MSTDKNILEQIEADRKRNQELYDDIKQNVITTQDYVMLGDVLVKVSDLMNKQTAQMIEIYKVKERNKPPENADFSLSKEEAEELQNEIEDMNEGLRSVK